MPPEKPEKPGEPEKPEKSPKRKSGKAAEEEEADPKRLKEAEEQKALKKRFAAAVAKATSLKAYVWRTSQAAQDLLALVGNSPEWSWCNNDHLLSNLRSALLAVEGCKKSNSFWQAWTVVEENDFATHLRKRFEAEAVVAEVTKGQSEDAGSLKTLVDRAQKEVSTPKRMQASRCSD